MKSINRLIYYIKLQVFEKEVCLFPIQVYSFCPETSVWKGEGSFECAGFNAGAVGMRDRIYILGGDYSPDEITDEVQAGKNFFYPQKLPYFDYCLLKCCPMS